MTGLSFKACLIKSLSLKAWLIESLSFISWLDTQWLTGKYHISVKEVVSTTPNAQTKSLYGYLCVQRHKFQRTAFKKKNLQGHIKLQESVELHTAKGDAARAICLL